MSELFSKVASAASRSIIDFIKETGFFRKIKMLFLPEFKLFSILFLSFIY